MKGVFVKKKIQKFVKGGVNEMTVVLINNSIKSKIVLDSSISPQTGNDTASFIINPGDKIVIRAVLNSGAKKSDDPDDILFEWCANIA